MLSHTCVYIYIYVVKGATILIATAHVRPSVVRSGSMVSPSVKLAPEDAVVAVGEVGEVVTGEDADEGVDHDGDINRNRVKCSGAFVKKAIEHDAFRD